jgi:hypothetical protein
MRLNYSNLMVFGFLFFSPPAAADCLKDLRGEVFCGAGRCATDSNGKVWCSRHYEGDAKRTLDGLVVCGIGRCAADIRGDWFCSSEIGGSVTRDSRGNMRCYGECQSASESNCESTPADSVQN